jgi:hypothetical protein
MICQRWNTDCENEGRHGALRSIGGYAQAGGAITEHYSTRAAVCSFAAHVSPLRSLLIGYACDGRGWGCLTRSPATRRPGGKISDRAASSRLAPDEVRKSSLGFRALSACFSFQIFSQNARAAA